MNPTNPQTEKISQLARRVDEIRAELQGENPAELAMRIGVVYQADGPQTGQFLLNLWDSPIQVGYPSFTAYRVGSREPLTVDIQALLAYHFQASQGVPLSGTWVAFSELPDGRFYAQAYQSYSGGALLRAFGGNIAAFETAAEAAGGRRADFADAAFAFQALPKVALLAAYWLGDEDFPPNTQILFDASVRHHLPTDVCAILGGMLAGRIVKAGRKGAG